MSLIPGLIKKQSIKNSKKLTSTPKIFWVTAITERTVFGERLVDFDFPEH